jgi:hypothetical protein
MGNATEPFLIILYFHLYVRPSTIKTKSWTQYPKNVEIGLVKMEKIYAEVWCDTIFEGFLKGL